MRILRYSQLQTFIVWCLLLKSPLPLICSFELRDALQVLCGQDPDCYLSYQWDRSMQYAFIYHFFGLLWTNQFIVGLACVTIAGEEYLHSRLEISLFCMLTFNSVHG